MDNPEDICKKYCKQRLQNITNDNGCPFSLVSSELELEGDDLKVHTVCEGTLNTMFKTVIDRITLITKTGIKVLKEVIKHNKMSLDEMSPYKWPGMDKPIPQYTPPPILPFPGGPVGPSPWTVTYSKTSWDKSNEDISDKS